MAVKTIITTEHSMIQVDENGKLMRKFEKVPITYYLPKQQALLMFYTNDSQVGRFVKAEEVQYKTLWDKFVDFIKRKK